MLHLINNNSNKILIENGCDSADINKLSKTLQEQSKVELSFISTDTVTSELVKLLVLHAKKIKLTTDSKSLWLYLRQFSINIMNETLIHKIDINKESTTLKAIAIGGSAGALENIVKIIKELPYSDITIFIVVHILSDRKSKLVDILSQCTSYKVKEAINGEKIELNCIYIASPNLHMKVENNYIYNIKSESVNYCRPSIDVLFKSLAIEYKNSLLAILTCGYLDDGAKSLIDIQKNNGLTIIQNPQECEADEIPTNAINTKNYTHIFNIQQINEYLKFRLNIVVNIDDRIKSFLDNIYKIYGYDFRDYDIRSVKRRIELLKLDLCVNTMVEVEHLVLTHRYIFDLLFKKLSINVSEFFRDPEVFKQIRDDVVPILESYPYIRVWCSACSHGQEPYSVAILLDEAGLLEKSIIYATDFNDTVLEEAKNALFSVSDYKKNKESYIKSGGTKKFEDWFNMNDNYMEVSSHIKEKVHFFQHNLATDSEINEFQLVFCRNVLIYFEEKLQKNVFKLIHNSLIKRGFLVLGKSETLSIDNGFTPIDKFSKNKIFKKI